MAPIDPEAPRDGHRSIRPTSEQLLKAWRAAERSLAGTAAGTAARAAAEREVAMCRAAYHSFQARTRDLATP